MDFPASLNYTSSSSKESAAPAADSSVDAAAKTAS
jgi:hypothetical protein